jgi:two-component system response regulator HydG
MSERVTILIVDDQAPAREILSRYLQEIDYRALTAESVAEAQQILEAESVDAVLVDLRMPGADGLQGLRQFRSRDPQLPVILVTAHATVESAVSAMKLGAFDYLRKPIEFEELEIVVGRALEHRRLVEENRKLRAVIADRYRLENLIGKSHAIQALFELIRKVGPADVPVLITGQSGTGKDLVARALHGQSSRAQRTFLSVNCAAVPENLLESELFGHERGAFSGAVRSRVGYFREADGGTLFLDEIADMSPGQQARLLRVLESGEVIPVGSEHAMHVDVRVIAATNADLESLVQQGRFREDLLFRIDTVHIQLPTLAERREDIPLLAAHFLERAGLTAGVRAPRLGAEAMRCLLAHSWPGNVRELAHAIEHAVLVADGEEIRPQDLPPRVRETSASASAWPAEAAGQRYRETRRDFDRAYFRAVLERAGGNVSLAASLAGIHRATFHKKLAALGLDPGDSRGNGRS